ncbi:DUF4872 domain-containing protein [Thermoleophilia bacterium SCSIO 60948]|nr:DUF4872 domain-containing protein [Thermoleophilia bacterium SCSIO 60948]
MQTIVHKFPHRRAGHCGSGALRDLLEFHGLSYGDAALREGAVFGLSGGLGFFYAALAGIQPPVYLVGRTADLERDFCSHVGVDLDLRQTDDPDEGWAVLRGELDAGRPTMVWADIKHLDYLRVRMHNTMHDIVVCGYDLEDGVAFVADNDRDDLQRCSLESLARARNSAAFPGPNRHATWVMSWPSELPAARAVVARAIERAVENMAGPAQPVLAGTGAGGLAGVDLFAGEYEGWPDQFGDDLGAVLRGLAVFIVKAGTAGAMFRSLHADFLFDAARWLDDEQLDELGATYAALSERWRLLAAAVNGEDDPVAAHAAGRDHVAHIAGLEHRGVEEMQAWLATR